MILAPKITKFLWDRKFVHLESLGFKNPHVGRDAVTKLDLDDVSEGQLLSLDGDFVSIPDTESILRNHVLWSEKNVKNIYFIVIF